MLYNLCTECRKPLGARGRDATAGLTVADFQDIAAYNPCPTAIALAKPTSIFLLEFIVGLTKNN